MKPINLKRFVVVSLGTLIMVFGLHFFLIPNRLAVGGASGLAMLINALVPSLSIPLVLFILNVILFIAGFLTIGRDFGGYTVYSALLLSFLLGIMESRFPVSTPLSNDLFINLLFGILIQGVGMGLVINRGASSGGTDILAKIIEKYSPLTFGIGLMTVDGLITLGAAWIYGANLGMYALLGVMINSVVIDKMIAGFSTKYRVTVITSNPQNVSDFIMNSLDRGVTMYMAEGGYSKEVKKIPVTILPRNDMVALKEFVRKTDPKAFMYIQRISEVEGEGYTFDLPG